MNNNKVNVYLDFGHLSFMAGKSAVIAVERLPDTALLHEYRDLAKKKLCKNIGLIESDVRVFDYKVLGEFLHIK